MRNPYLRCLSLALSALAVLSSAPPASADDTEIFISQPASTVQSNIMLIIDSSGSMNETADVSKLPYDPTQSYSNSNTNCDSSRIYVSNGSTAPNKCDGLTSFPASNFKCQAGNSQLNFGSGAAGSGFFTDRFIRWGGSSSSKGWNSNFSPNNATDIECRADAGVHGPDSSSSAKWPQSGTANQSSGRWTSTASQSWWGVSGNVGLSATLYSPNYIRYVRNGPSQIQTRMEVVKAAAASFLNSLPNVNLGVMRYDAGNAQGGMVMSPVSPLDPKRADLITEITTSNHFEPYGNTPLSETLYEAYLYFAGKTPQYGNGSKICTDNTASDGNTGSCQSSNIVSYPSISTSKSGTKYLSPASEPCQANYIVYLTDGLPTSDNDADSLITGLPNFGTLAGAGCSGSGAGRCLGALTEYLANSQTDLRTDVQGNQNVKTYYIGFGSDFAGSLNTAFAYLQAAAQRGGTQAYQASDLTGLSAVFNAIVTSIFQTSTTFTTPTVAVNAFNRTQTLNDLFVSVFQPNSTLHWPGNVKKYRVQTSGIVDSSNPPKPAVDPSTGFFADGTRSFWSNVNDGSNVKDGGAASQLPTSANRKLYTYLGANPGSPVTLSGSASYSFSTSNTAITDSLLLLGSSGDPSRTDLINWARGDDLRDEDGDSSTTTRHSMGDPIHSPPAVVIYGGTPSSPNVNDGVLYVTTNDGYLHAFDPNDGSELWAFIPQEFLGNLKNLYFDDPVPSKGYTLDGEIRVLKYDINGDGIVDSGAGDKVILYFGQGRGGSRYYAIDVTSKTAPKFMWSIGPTELPGLGLAWAPPVITRVNIGGATQNSQKLVLVIGGGYDPAEDGTAYLPTASVGNRIFMIDALRGTRLWSAGPTSSGASFERGRMTNSIPSAVTVLDTNSDSFADRMYVGDMGGQVWRFDITNGNNAGSLVTGGAIATLGTHDDATPVPANARRFYSAPDVTAVQSRGMTPFFNIALGSGYRGHPLNTAVQDRFYSIRDRKPFTRLTQADYDDMESNSKILKDSSLQDITTDVTAVIPADSPGWKLQLTQNGEKSLSSANTFDNKLFFTTYSPPSGTSSASCGASSTGSNRAYVISVFNGAPIPRRDSGTDTGGTTGGGTTTPLTAADRYTNLAQGGIAPEVAFLFPQADAIMCLSGVEVLSACTNFNSRVKTYWRESDAN